MPGLSGIAFDVLRSHAGLWCLYLERVVAKADDDRLADPEVKVAVEQQAGLYPELVRTSAFRAKS
jgi:hypothetical protein